jgi:DNA-binding MarR family transcriptional regulator
VKKTRPVDPSRFRLETQLCFALYSAHRTMTSAYRPVLGRFDLTYPQYLVMLVLWEEDGIALQQLGDRLYLDSATLSPLLKRLERNRLIKRTRIPEDERELSIRLTSEGRSLRDKVLQAIAGLACKIGITPEQAAVLRREINKIKDAIHTSGVTAQAFERQAARPARNVKAARGRREIAARDVLRRKSA